MGTGTGPCGNSAHQQFPSGSQVMTAPHCAHRVSIQRLSIIAALEQMGWPFRAQADAALDLWQTQCLRGMVFSLGCESERAAL
jgi:hypothetical protein